MVVNILLVEAAAKNARQASQSNPVSLGDVSTAIVHQFVFTKRIIVATLSVQIVVVREFLVKDGRLSGYNKDGAACSGGRASSSRNGWQIFGRHDGRRRFPKNSNPTNVEICDSTTIYNTDSAVFFSNRHTQKRAHTNR